MKSRQGLETSTRQGWHTGGIAAYGYRFVEHDHPNPHKAARGQRKRTLGLDPVRAPVVKRIYDLYLSGGAGITQIRDALNAHQHVTLVNLINRLADLSSTAARRKVHAAQVRAVKAFNGRLQAMTRLTARIQRERQALERKL